MANQCLVSSLSSSRDILGRLKFKMGHNVTTPISGMFAIHRLGFAMINPYTKFEVSMFTHYEDMKGNAKCKNWVWG